MFNTPGPWAADGEPRQAETGKHKCIWQINKDGSLAHTEPIATVWYYLHPGDANADLIAAAPDLLEALEQVKPAIESLVEKITQEHAPDWGLVNDTLRRVESVLRKVQGVNRMGPKPTDIKGGGGSTPGPRPPIRKPIGSQG